MLAIRLPEDVETRLDKLALKTGRTKTYYAREAICEYLDDLEDYYLADARSRNKVKAISLDEVERRLGLAD
ncbi:MAG: toxin-antitoxin system antitoxin subunit [Burkholderiales bacterium]